MKREMLVDIITQTYSKIIKSNNNGEDKTRKIKTKEILVYLFLQFPKTKVLKEMLVLIIINERHEK